MEYSAKEQETEQKLDDLEMRVNNLTNQIQEEEKKLIKKLMILFYLAKMKLLKCLK